MALSSEELMINLNLLLCLCGGFVAICRMGLMTKSGTKGTVRVIYMLYMMMFATSGISYWWDEPAGIAQILMGACVLCILLMGFGAWRNGAPAHTNKPVSAIWTNPSMNKEIGIE